MQQRRMYNYREGCIIKPINKHLNHFFFIFNFTCCKFVSLKTKNLTHFLQYHYSKQTKHTPQGFLCADQDVSLTECIWGVSIQAQSSELSHSVGPKNWFHSPLSWSQTTYWQKKVSLITCRQTLAKTLLAACIFIYTIMNYFKKLDGIKTLNTKQCLQRLSPRIIHQAISF